MNTETVDRNRTLTTADFAATGERPLQREAERERERAAAEQVETRPQRDDEQLAALFSPDMAGDFRSRWDAVQIGFVDDPQQAVKQADELVAQVMKNLAETFANERHRLEEQMGTGGGASTENLRVALRRYRSFFQRLLSL